MSVRNPLLLALALSATCRPLVAGDVDWKPLPRTAPARADNPSTPGKIALGKKLYFDPRLSSSGTVSCNTCHNLMEGGDDGRPTSMGVLGRLGGRNAPTVWNAAFNATQFWDGRAADLEAQAKGPLVADVEMNMGSHEFVVERIASIPGYRAEFARVFGDEEIDIDDVANAIAVFEQTLITPDSPFDEFVGGKTAMLSDSQRRGFQSFRELGCASCHSGPAFNGVTLGIEPDGYTGYSVFPLDTETKSVSKYRLAEDEGRYDVTGKDSDKHRFRIPTLRNVTLTAPYFHNGSVSRLDEAVRVMAETQLATELTTDEVADLVAFLGSLTGTFPEITLPRLPSQPGASVLVAESQTSAQVFEGSLPVVFATFDRSYVPALALTKMQKPAAGMAMARLRKAVVKLDKSLNTDVRLRNDWPDTRTEIQEAIEAASSRLANGKSLEAHEELEAVRGILMDFREKHGIAYDLDLLNAFHETMERIVKPALERTDVDVEFREELGKLLTLAKQQWAEVEKADFSKAVYSVDEKALKSKVEAERRALQRLEIVLRGKDASATLQAARGLKPPFAKLYTSFGDPSGRLSSP